MFLTANKGGRRHLLYACNKLPNKPFRNVYYDVEYVCMYKPDRYLPLYIYGALGVRGIRMLSHFDDIRVVQGNAK